MLQISEIRSAKEETIKRLQIRGVDRTGEIEEVLTSDEKRRSLQREFEDNLAEVNALSKEIGELFKSGQAGQAQEMKSKTTEIKERNKALSEEIQGLEEKIRSILLEIPNTPDLSVPKGNSEEDNEVVLTNGQIPELSDKARPHWELADQYDIIDFELGTKLTGAGFPVYKGKGATLQRGLINFFLDEARRQGYTEVQPPILVNEDSGYGTGQLPDKEGQMYHVGLDNLYLIPTAEVPITNLYRDVIIKEKDLPIKNTGYTPCFRREAGSYGKDVRGLNRLHQFDKVEIVQVTTPNKSYEVLEEMQSYVQSLLQKLDLPYRVLKLCGGDLSFASALTYDMEVYSAAQKRWLEVSSISNFETFQTNRLKLRFKDDSGKNRLAHSLNGSALALPRIVAALLENNQTESGIEMPEVLHPYLGFDRIN